MNTNVDLRELAVRRTPVAAPAYVRPNRHLATRYVLPGAVLFGFLAVMAWAARDSFLPSRAVTVIPIISARADMQSAGTPLFQSAGWVEPRPTPILVTALTEGVVDKLLVVEGQLVKAGDQVALLVQSDARLALQAAEAELDLRIAECEMAKAVQKAARTNLEKPVTLQAAHAEAEAVVAEKETELAGLPFQLNAARSRLVLAQQNYESKKDAALSGALPETVLRQARSDWETARAAVAELENREGQLQRQITAQKGRRDALKTRLDLKIDEFRAAGEADAGVKSAAARLKQAEIAVAAARLRLDRTIILAPVDGQVLALVARPGMRLMGQTPLGQQESSTVITMFDPNLLQVRADVRLEDVPRVLRGQKVKVETPAAPDGPLEGEVLQVTSQADIQKNTLQVKVAIPNPPATLRPDMLVQVTFLAPSSPSEARDQQTVRLLVPPQVIEAADGGKHVWIADLATKSARKRPVTLGRTSGEWVEILDGLNPGDRVISSGRQDLRDGQRIAVTGEDAMGIPSAAHEQRLQRLPSAAQNGSSSGKK